MGHRSCGYDKVLLLTTRPYGVPTTASIDFPSDSMPTNGRF
jgi:hypothetical protein